MKRSLPPYFAWISLLAFALASCCSVKSVSSGGKAGEISDAFSSATFEKINLKAIADYRDKELAGRLLVKKTGDGIYKIAFYNELGMTYLEGTFIPASGRNYFKMNNIIPALDNRIFIKSFAKCLQKVFSFRENAGPSPGKPPEGGNLLVVRLKNGFSLGLTVPE